MKTPSLPVPKRRPEPNRRLFFRRTYMHLAGAIAVFAVVEDWLLRQPFVPVLVETMAGSNWRWLVVLGLFLGVALVAQHVARTRPGSVAAYAGLALYVAAEAVIFAPLLYVAGELAPGAIPTAAVLTVALAGALTVAAWAAPRAFSVPHALLAGTGVLLNVVIVTSLVAGFRLGVFFSVLVVAWAALSILRGTVDLQDRYGDDEYVLASLHLLTDVALMFWYVLRVLVLSKLEDD